MKRQIAVSSEKILTFVPPFLVFVAGSINILSALFSIPEARLAILEEILPMMVMHASRTLTLVTGVFLIILARGLSERKVMAWRLSVVLLGASLLFNITKGIDIEEAIFILFTLYTLILSRQVYVVASDLFKPFSALKTSLIAFVLLFVYSLIGYLLFRHQFKGAVYFPNIALDYFHTVFGVGRDALIPAGRQAYWFQTSIISISLGIFVFFFSSLFAPYLKFLTKKTEIDPNILRAFVLRYSKNSVSYFSLVGNKHFYIKNMSQGFLAYGIKAGVALSLGEPIVQNEADALELITHFEKDMNNRGLKTAAYQITEDSVPTYEKLKMKVVKIGEEAIIKIHEFQLQTPQFAEIRHCVSRLKRLKASYEWYRMDELPDAVLYEIQKLHQHWIESKNGIQLQFSMDFFPFPKERNGYVLCVWSEAHQLWSALSFYPYNNGAGMGLDIMTRSQDAPNSTMEAAIAESIRYFGEKGFREVSLGMAPLADTEKEKSKTVLEKGITLLYNNVTTLYGYRSLFKFKNKFSPTWRKKYLAFASYTELPSVALALLRLHLEG